MLRISGLKTTALILLLIFANFTFAQSEVADRAMQRDIADVSRLLQDGADVNAGQSDGATALHWAAYHNDVSLAELLLESGANPEVANRNGSTPLWLATNQGDSEMI